MEAHRFISAKGKAEFRFTMSEQEYHNMDNDSEGCCVRCGEVAYGVEPDARNYTCESCDKPGVYGAQELLMMDRIEFSE